MLAEADLALLTNDQRARLKRLEELFGSDGWKEVIVDLTDRASKIRDSVIDMMGEKELFFAKGQVAAILAIVNYEALVDAEYRDLLANVELAHDEIRESQGSNA